MWPLKGKTSISVIALQGVPRAITFGSLSLRCCFHCNIPGENETIQVRDFLSLNSLNTCKSPSIEPGVGHKHIMKQGYDSVSRNGQETNAFKLLADSQLAICEGVMNAYFKKGAHFSKYGGNKFERGGVNKVWALSFKNL